MHLDLKVDQHHLLRTMLPFAVYLNIQQFKKIPLKDVLEATKGVPDLIAAKGDILLFGGGKKGEQAEVFNALAKGVAACAFVPGGVTVLGNHYEEKHDG